MSTLYSQSTQNNYSNFNDGGSVVADARYAWQFVPSATGIPGKITLYLQGIVGTPTGEIYIRADKTSGSTTYGSATGITFTSGTNVITLSSGSSITSGTTYWVFFKRTTTDSAYPQFQYDTTKNNYQIWRPTLPSIDPDNNWQTNDVKMLIETGGTAFTQTCNEVVTVVTSLTNLAGKVANETVTIVASMTRSMTRSLNEVVTIVASSSASLIITRSFNEIVAIVDSVASRISAKVFSEVITVSETLSKLVAYARSYSETVTVTAAVTIQKNLVRAYSETITIVASITNIKALGRVFNEVITITQRFQGLINGLDISWARKYSNQAGTWLGKYSSQAGTWIKKYFDIP